MGLSRRCPIPWIVDQQPSATVPAVPHNNTGYARSLARMNGASTDLIASATPRHGANELYGELHKIMGLLASLAWHGWQFLLARDRQSDAGRFRGFSRRATFSSVLGPWRAMGFVYRSITVAIGVTPPGWSPGLGWPVLATDESSTGLGPALCRLSFSGIDYRQLASIVGVAGRDLVRE